MYNVHEVEVEKIIKYCLVGDSTLHKQVVPIQMVSLYEAVLKNFVGSGNKVLSTRDFNGVVQSMKRAGIVGTAKGGEIIFLTANAFEMYVQPELDKTTETAIGNETKAGA